MFAGSAIRNKDEIIENCEMIKQVLTDTAALDAEVVDLHQEVAVVTELIRQCVDENARIGLEQSEYQLRYNELVERYEKAKSMLGKIEELRQARRRVKREKFDTFLATVLGQDSIIEEFDESLWYAVIDKVTIYSSEDIQFTFRDGTVVKA
ncbi:hypothetical protein [Desulfosporosinus sp.]|uniref:hypothetical protein n=1 Tax=Desulfosporosinus sp. TaxID=157907 RepID=UPI0026135EA9|nr:hypothetical protein [Desulfosporosinus sp.]